MRLTKRGKRELEAIARDRCAIQFQNLSGCIRWRPVLPLGDDILIEQGSHVPPSPTHRSSVAT